MPRPHIEFIQTQMLDWERSNINSSALVKNLSFDNSNGASTNIIRYPENFEANTSHYLECDEEFLILSGRILINENSYAKGDYAFFPSGYSRRKIKCEEQTDILTYYEGRNKPIFSKEIQNIDHSRLVVKLETIKADWGKATDPKIAALGVKRLELRSDPINGEKTWLLDISPNMMDSEYDKKEIHPVVEEVFVISGEMHLPMGVLKKGAYFWRPPNISHGPVGTRKGATGIFRSKGGPLKTEWSKETYQVIWSAKYAPILPKGLLSKLNVNYDKNIPY